MDTNLISSKEPLRLGIPLCVVFFHIELIMNLTCEKWIMVGDRISFLTPAAVLVPFPCSNAMWNDLQIILFTNTIGDQQTCCWWKILVELYFGCLI